MRNTKLFTHTDLDGIGCAIVAKSFLEDVDVEYCDYNNINEKVINFLDRKDYINCDTVLITDISINEEVAERLEEELYNQVNFLKLIDHHPTAKWLNKYEWAYVNETEYGFWEDEEEVKSSGTSMLFDLLEETLDVGFPQLEEFVEKVRRYDTWEWNTKYDDLTAKELNDLFYIVGRERFIERFMDNLSMELSIGEIHLLEIEKEKIAKYINSNSKKLKVYKINNRDVGVVFAEQYHSELGNELSKANSHLDLIAMINPSSKKVSYRTIHEHVNVGEFAKAFGGGGHPKAAGSQFDIDDNIVEMFFRNNHLQK
ncbi:DHH family phosphoesterase [Priestia endophytica]